MNLFLQNAKRVKKQNMGKRKAKEIELDDIEDDLSSVDSVDIYNDSSADEDENEPSAKKAKRTSDFIIDTTKQYTKTDLNTLKKSDLVSLTLAFQDLARKQGHAAVPKQSKSKKHQQEIDVPSQAAATLRKLKNRIQREIVFKKHSGRFEITKVEREVFIAMFPQYQFKPTNLVLSISCSTPEEIEKAVDYGYSYRDFRFRGRGTLTKLIIRHVLEEKRITVSFQYKTTGIFKGDDDERLNHT